MGIIIFIIGMIVTGCLLTWFISCVMSPVMAYILMAVLAVVFFAGGILGRNGTALFGGLLLTLWLIFGYGVMIN